MDDSLDDFFAKKDKSKKKGKSKSSSSKTKFVAADLLPATPPNESSGTEDIPQQKSDLKVEEETGDILVPKEKKKTKRKKDRDAGDDQRRKEVGSRCRHVGFLFINIHVL